MTQELAKKLMIVSIRNGVELSIEKDKLDEIKSLMEIKRFVSINGRPVNTADIVGIFNPEDMEAVIRRKNGQWQGKDSKWHNRGEHECSYCGNIVPYGKQCGVCK